MSTNSHKLFRTISSVRLYFLLLAVSCLSPSYAEYGSVIVKQVNSIYDGDTFRVDIKDYPPPLVGKNISIRINGVDTPEIKGKCQAEKTLAIKAKKYVVSALKRANLVELRNLKRGKYFRIVADVYVDGVNLGDGLINNNLAVKYSGQKKLHSWCNE